jgi:ABC-type transport system substrate-binding protein
MKSKIGFSALIAVGLVVLMALAFAPQADVSAAPQAIPTPVSVTRPAAENYITFNPFTAAVLDEDTTSTCYDVAAYSIIDALYVIDQTEVNTVTLTAKWSIDGTTLVDGVNLVANNAADASDMTQLQVFGRYFCVLANVTNTEDVTITVQAIAK